MPSPGQVFQEIVKTVYKAQAVRYKLAKSVFNALKQLKSAPSIFEVNGYQTYVWVPAGANKEYRVWPPTLTGPSGGWISTKGYLSRTSIIPVNWGDVFTKLSPKFTIKLSVLSLIHI